MHVLVVRETVFGKLEGHPQITLTDPVDVEDMHNAMSRSVMVMTDSGGQKGVQPVTL